MITKFPDGSIDRAIINHAKATWSNLRVASPRVADSSQAINEKLDKLLTAQPKQDLTSKYYLTKSEVAELLGVSEKSVDVMRRKAILPQPKKIPLSENTKGRTVLRWRKTEVTSWIDAY